METKQPKLPVGKIRRIGFLATRLAGTDGVTLETAKWIAVLEQLGYQCFCVAGEFDRETKRTYRIPEAAFTHPEIVAIQRQSFGNDKRPRALSKRINDSLVRIKDELYRCQAQLKIDLWIVENCLAIPMHISLGLAVTEFLAETGLPCIAHHHDFSWERERFSTTAVSDYLHGAFPPKLPSVRHVVISSVAQAQFSYRLGASSTLIPNVMDFEEPPPRQSQRARSFRREIGVGEKDWLILQPTRVVARKQIEHAIELVKRLAEPHAQLVITHSTGDEGDEYAHHIRQFARMLLVPVKFVYDRMQTEGGRRRGAFSIADAYGAADLVTYPSGYEGFGNAFLEAIYYRRPIVCNRYSIYQTDIEPKGFQAILMDGFVSDTTVRHARQALTDQKCRREMVEHNYELGRQYFSYAVLRAKLEALLTEFGGIAH